MKEELVLLLVSLSVCFCEEIPINGNPWPQSFGQQVQSQAQAAAEHVDRAGQSLASVGDKLANSANNAVNQVGNAVREAGELAINKLREAKNEISEKFRPVLDNAIEIFQQPAGNIKERWDKVRLTAMSWDYVLLQLQLHVLAGGEGGADEPHRTGEARALPEDCERYFRTADSMKHPLAHDVFYTLHEENKSHVVN